MKIVSLKCNTCGKTFRQKPTGRWIKITCNRCTEKPAEWYKDTAVKTGWNKDNYIFGWEGSD